MPSKQRKSSDFDMHYYLWQGSGPLKQKQKGENILHSTAVKYKSGGYKGVRNRIDKLTIYDSLIIARMKAFKSRLTV